MEPWFSKWKTLLKEFARSNDSDNDSNSDRLRVRESD